MIYKKASISSNSIKRELLLGFDFIEKYIRQKKSAAPIISLHCKYEINDIWEKTVTFYLVSNDTADVSQFIEKWKFEKVSALPPSLVHILGNYGAKVKEIDRSKFENNFFKTPA